jgi:hypothetical protein
LRAVNKTVFSAADPGGMKAWVTDLKLSSAMQTVVFVMGDHPSDAIASSLLDSDINFVVYRPLNPFGSES